jgi:hypothetical protein
MTQQCWHALPAEGHILNSLCSNPVAVMCWILCMRDSLVLHDAPAGSNERGQYLRVYESGGGYPSGGSSLMIPCGWANAYLKLFYESLEKIARQLSQDGSTVCYAQHFLNCSKARGDGYTAVVRQLVLAQLLDCHQSVLVACRAGGSSLHKQLEHKLAMLLLFLQGFDFEQALAAASDLAPAPAADAVVLDAKEGGPVLSVGSK